MGMVRKEVAGLLDTGLRSSTGGITSNLRESIWELLQVLAEDPEPTPEYEERYGGSNMDPATLA